MQQESTIQKRIQLALSEAGCTVFRNETGNYWAGKRLHKTGDQVTLANASMVACGLCKGSSDVIGITPSGRFMAVEVKTASGRASDEQVNFIARVNEAGGVAGIARSPEEALQLLEAKE